MKRRLVIWLFMTIWATMVHVSGSLKAQDIPGLSTLAWSPDGMMIAAADTNGLLYILDANTGAILQQFEGNQGNITSLSWRPDSTRLASASPDDGLIRIWDASGKLIAELPGERSSDHLAFVKWNPKGDLLASVASVVDGGSPLQIWNARNDSYQLLPTTYTVASYDMAWSPDGTKLAVADYRAVYIFTDFSSGSLNPVSLSPFAFTIAWSPDGSQLAIADTTGLIQILNSNSGQIESSFQGAARDGQHGISTLAWSPDGQLLAGDNYDGTTQIWNVRSDDLIQTLDVERSGGRGLLSWSPSGGRLVLGSATRAPIQNQKSLLSLGNTLVQIVIPAPSLDRLRAIADSCTLPKTAAQSLPTQATADSLENFMTVIQALPAGAIPPACAADLVAVAQALQAQ